MIIRTETERKKERANLGSEQNEKKKQTNTQINVQQRE